MTADQTAMFGVPGRRSTAHEWVAGRRAEIDRLEAFLDDMHGALSVPSNPRVEIGVNWQHHLRVTVGTARRTGIGSDRVVTGRQLTAVIGPDIEVYDTTSSGQCVDDISLGKVGLRRSMTAQQVVDALVAAVGPDQCQVCGDHGDHTPGTDEAPYCAAHCPDRDEDSPA